MHDTVCNYTQIYAHLNGIYQGWGVIAKMNGIVYNPRELSDHLAMLGGYQLIHVWYQKNSTSLTNYVFGVAMGGLLFKLQNFKKVKLIFGHPVPCPVIAADG